MPSTYIVITRKTLQSLSNSFANPLANWFFHLSSYEFPARVYIYIYMYIFVTYSSVCISVGRMGKKGEENVASMDDLVRHAQKIAPRFESRSVRVRAALVILTHLRATPVLLAFFYPPSSTPEFDRVEPRHAEDAKEIFARSKLDLLSFSSKRFELKSVSKF